MWWASLLLCVPPRAYLSIRSDPCVEVCSGRETKERTVEYLSSLVMGASVVAAVDACRLDSEMTPVAPTVDVGSVRAR